MVRVVVLRHIVAQVVPVVLACTIAVAHLRVARVVLVRIVAPAVLVAPACMVDGPAPRR